MAFPDVFPVTCHTDFVGPESTFVAIVGMQHDGVAYISLALQKGARTIVVQNDVILSEDLMQQITSCGALVIRVDNTRKTLAHMSAQKLGHPAQQLKIIGVTGTKGKTTSVYLLEHLLRTSGRKTALMSTVHNYINGQQVPDGLTTPQPDYLHVFFAECISSGVEYVVMEVSAQALSLHRIEGINFDGIIFTNFEQEHAEFYSSIDDYFQAKCLLFNYLKRDTAVLVNYDDRWLQKILAESCIKIFSLLHNNADYVVTDFNTNLDGSYFRLTWKEKSIPFYSSTLVGKFNGYNMVGVLALLIELGFDDISLKKGLKTFRRVPGRLEGYVLPNGAQCFIDYAHTPASFESVLSLLRTMTNQLIVVFGAGGERDHSKRPQMGLVTVQYADMVILTTDNPRSEDPVNIIEDIKKGIAFEKLAKIDIELDREVAIKKAYAHSKPDSIILLLGKGPDEYQLVMGKKTKFSEKEIIAHLR